MCYLLRKAILELASKYVNANINIYHYYRRMSGLDHGPISAAPISEEEAVALARLLHALADKTRIAIVGALLHSPDGELHARALQELLGLRQPTASHHLRKLVRSGILGREQRGPYAYYSIDPGAFARLRAIFGESEG